MGGKGRTVAISKIGTVSFFKCARVCSSSAWNSSLAYTASLLNQPIGTLPYMLVIRPVLSLACWARAAATASGSPSNAMRSLVPPRCSSVTVEKPWSCMFWPTPASACTTGMPCFASSSAGPMPESMSSCGELSACVRDISICEVRFALFC